MACFNWPEFQLCYGVVSIFLVMIMAAMALGSAQLPIYEASISAPTMYHLASRNFSL
jgi:hypothetical protein